MKYSLIALNENVNFFICVFHMCIKFNEMNSESCFVKNMTMSGFHENLREHFM